MIDLAPCSPSEVLEDRDRAGDDDEEVEPTYFLPEEYVAATLPAVAVLVEDATAPLSSGRRPRPGSFIVPVGRSAKHRAAIAGPEEADRGGVAARRDGPGRPVRVASMLVVAKQAGDQGVGVVGTGAPATPTKKVALGARPARLPADAVLLAGLVGVRRRDREAVTGRAMRGGRADRRPGACSGGEQLVMHSEELLRHRPASAVSSARTWNVDQRNVAEDIAEPVAEPLVQILRPDRGWSCPVERGTKSRLQQVSGASNRLWTRPGRNDAGK